MKTHPISILIVLLFGLLAMPALAQQSGTLYGTVEDVNGTPVSGVKVTTTSPALIGGARESLTAEGGSFRFIQLPVGNYEVRAEGKGLKTVVQKGLRVSLGASTDVFFVMELESGEQVIEVTARAPIVDRRSTTLGLNLDQAFLEKVPGSRDYQGVANFLPGVTDSDGDGNPSIHGGSSYSNNYYVDGINTTDPSTNTFNLNFNFDAIDEVQVISGGFSPEYGNITGGIINLVTKSGSNTFELDTSVYFESDALSMEGLDEAPRDSRSFQGNLNLGGPLIIDRLWYFVSLEYDNRRSQLPNESPVPRLNGVQHEARVFQSLYWLTKLTFAPDTRNKIELLLQGDPTTVDNAGQDPSAGNETETHQDQGGVLASLNYVGNFEPLLVEMKAGYKLSFLDIFPQERAKSSSPFRFPGVFGLGELTGKNSFGDAGGCLQDVASTTDLTGTGCSGTDIQAAAGFGQGPRFNLDTGEQTGGSGSDSYIERTRLELAPAVTYFFKGAHGEHALKLGSTISITRDKETSKLPGGASIFVDADADGDGDADPLRARIASSDDNALTTTNNGRIIALYALDTWDIAKRVVLQPGVRYDMASFDFYEGYADDAEAATGERPDPEAFAFDVVSPRLQATVDVMGDGRTSVLLGYGRMYEVGMLTLSKFVGKSLETRRSLWVEDPNGRLSDPDEPADAPIRGSYVESEDPGQQSVQGGAGGTAIDRDGLEPTGADVWMASVAHAVTDDLRLQLTYFHKSVSNAWEDDERNIIWNRAGNDYVGTVDGTGQQTYTLRKIDDAQRTYESIELSLFKRLSDRWFMHTSWTLSWNTGTTTELLTGAYDNPTQNVFLDGPLLEDHRHVIKSQFSYEFDSGLSLGGAYTYETGAPYDQLHLNQYDGGYTNRRAPRGESQGIDPNDPEDDVNLRLADFTRLDLRAAFDFEKLSGHKFTAMVDIFNALNASTVTSVEESLTETGNWGQATGYQKPFQAQLGLRYQY
ncbi:MAG: TonB-dependent receptor [Myxococcales bacterium]|nr:TonB-dependent receptor [Myxococcales bacterium]